jgi:mono/diheme cytochrome c family protein
MPAENFAVIVVHPHEPDAAGEADAASKQIANGLASGCLLPRAAAYAPRGQWLVVACQGQDAVWRLDARTVNKVSQPTSWHVDGEPSGVAIDADRRQLFVWSQRARTVSSVAVDAYHASHVLPDTDGMVHVAALGPRVDMADAVARGRELFHKTGDPRISSDGRACASCHPDGRDDGLVWATPDGPRQTPTLAGRLAGTAPYGWNGARSTVKKHVTNTLVRLGGTGLDDASMNALVAYCMTMAPPPKPALETASVDPLVAEGRDLFESSSTGCASCHMSDGTFTDGNRHDVKSKAKGDPKRRFDTPSLRFVAGTAPYFHDGRYATLRALLVGSDGKMGHTRQLSPHELDALEAYLRTL